jgi:hypothetical protein
LAGLAQGTTSKGGRIDVDEIKGGSPASVTTSTGTVIEAGAVVVATNTPVNDVTSIHTKQAPYLTYAIALSIAERSIPHILLWDTGDPYHYVRIAQSSDGAELLIVGGEDHKTGQASDQAARSSVSKHGHGSGFRGPVRSIESGRVRSKKLSTV